MKKVLLPAAAITFAALVSSCSTGTMQSADAEARLFDEPTRTFVFECDGDFEVVAHVMDEKSWLFLPKRTVELKQQQTLTGMQYGDGDTSFGFEGQTGWFKGKEGEYRQCPNNRRKAIWEDAKLRGVDFRAVGNEPGWNVEVWSNHITYVGDYGTVRHTFDRPARRTDVPTAVTIYQTKNDDVSFKMQIRGVECSDTMSDETYASEVIIWVGGRELRGCGKALH